MIRQNVRIPDMVMGDLNAQLAACNVGARRIAELAEELGWRRIGRDFAELLRRSETMTRAALRAHPGRHLPLMSITTTMTASSSTSPSASRSLSRSAMAGIHCRFRRHHRAGARAVELRAVRGRWRRRASRCGPLTDPEIPTNGGCFRPISLELPPGSIVNPREPAPVNARTSTIKRIAGLHHRALDDGVPDRSAGRQWRARLLAVMFGGQTRRWRRLRRPAS